MTEEQFDQWVVALRSGKYPQQKHALHGPNGFCCLGVLAEISNVTTKIQEDDRYMFFFGPEYGDYESRTSLPEGYLGIPYSEQGSLMELNDQMGYTFGEIADYLEANKEEFINGDKGV